MSFNRPRLNIASMNLYIEKKFQMSRGRKKNKNWGDSVERELCYKGELITHLYFGGIKVTNVGNLGKSTECYAKIVDLNRWRKEKIVAENFNSLQSYFSHLDFNELMTESRELLTNILDGQLNEEISLKMKALLAEFDNRLASQSEIMSNALTEIKNKIACALVELGL